MTVSATISNRYSTELPRNSQVERFKNEISCFNFDASETREETANKLATIIPQDIKKEELIEIIFEYAYARDLSPILNAGFPELSPYDELRKAIVEDTEHLLDNAWLSRAFENPELDITEEKKAACYNLAYRANHPNIYPLSNSSTRDFSLNFLWVNLNPQDRVENIANNIFGDGLNHLENSVEGLETTEDPEIKKTFTYRISKWAEANPGTQMNLWYDSALVTERAQRATFETMKALSESKGVDLKLRDIRSLPNIPAEITRSLHPGTPVYYRVDMLKVLITDFMMSSPDTPQYCIISDIDVKPMNSEQLFDARTLNYLSSDGYVFNRVGLNNFENSFSIFNKEKDDLREVHRESLVESMESHITELRQYNMRDRISDQYILGSQAVFRKYQRFKSQTEKGKNLPRKVVKCPKSQFNFGGNFSESDHRAETFRFIYRSNTPYVENGRENQLISWTAEPLPIPS